MSPRLKPRQLDYAVLAQQHRPSDQSQLAREARQLAARGLTEGDIGSALKLDVAEVRRLLAASASEAAEIHKAHSVDR